MRRLARFITDWTRGWATAARQDPPQGPDYWDGHTTGYDKGFLDALAIRLPH